MKAVFFVLCAVMGASGAIAQPASPRAAQAAQFVQGLKLEGKMAREAMAIAMASGYKDCRFYGGENVGLPVDVPVIICRRSLPFLARCTSDFDIALVMDWQGESLSLPEALRVAADRPVAAARTHCE